LSRTDLYHHHAATIFTRGTSNYHHAVANLTHGFSSSPRRSNPQARHLKSSPRRSKHHARIFTTTTPQQTSRAALQSSPRRSKHHARTSIIITPQQTSRADFNYHHATANITHGAYHSRTPVNTSQGSSPAPHDFSTNNNHSKHDQCVMARITMLAAYGPQRAMSFLTSISANSLLRCITNAVTTSPFR